MGEGPRQTWRVNAAKVQNLHHPSSLPFLSIGLVAHNPIIILKISTSVSKQGNHAIFVVLAIEQQHKMSFHKHS